MDAGVYATERFETIMRLSGEKTAIAQKLQKAIQSGDEFSEKKYRFHLNRVTATLEQKMGRA